MTKNLQNIAIGVAMSGGVDSSVTAALLQEKGARVKGFFMALAQPDLEDQISRVRQVTEFLNIPLEIINLQHPFELHVLDYFQKKYAIGKTPNPCVICNHKIKFGMLQKEILKTCDMMATGHYVQLHESVSGNVELRKGRDPAKDQSYFLCHLTQQQLTTLSFPLGNFEKTYVRELAAAYGLSTVHGAESQDVCFLKGCSVQEFLEEKLPLAAQSGSVITQDGTEIGRHHGIHRFTIGQRRGLGLPDSTPWYVIRLDPSSNAVVVGKEHDLWQRDCTVGKVNWLNTIPTSFPNNCMVKIRNRHIPAPARLDARPENILHITFDSPQRAVTPGQFAVFYEGDTLIGGGEILEFDG